MSGSQLAFDLEYRPALGEDDFLVAPCNSDAVAWIDRFPDWPTKALVVSGELGSGKTHLTRVFMAKTKAVDISASTLRNNAVPVLPDADAIVIENADQLASDDTAEEALFHLYNQAREAETSMLLTAAKPPARWPIKLADLSSRLRTISSATIGAPDDALLSAVIVKLFADRQLTIEGSVLDYAIARMERTFDAARRFVADADRKALEKKRRITVPLVRDILER